MRASREKAKQGGKRRKREEKAKKFGKGGIGGKK
jgi:hypothetical protein